MAVITYNNSALRHSSLYSLLSIVTVLLLLGIPYCTVLLSLVTVLLSLVTVLLLIGIPHCTVYSL